MGKANQKTIYIRDEYMDIWEKIEKAASADSYGIGLFMCKVWQEYNELKKGLKK